MSDSELIDAVARLWVENGGDADGISWTVALIRERVQELQDGEGATHD